MALGDKPTALATPEFRSVANQVSKMALIDLCFDLMCKIEGETEMLAADRAAALSKFNEHFEVVAVHRKDKLPKLPPRVPAVM